MRRAGSTASRPSSQTRPPQAGPLYVPLDFFMVRTPLLPIERYLALGCDSVVKGEEAGSEEADALDLAKHLDDPRVQRALVVGSMDLMDAVQRGARGGLSGRDARRLRSRLLRYLIRMSTRPTPYGLFAGVALGGWASATNLAVADPAALVRTRLDMGWLLALVDSLEARPEVRHRLRMIANPAAFIDGGRLVLSERRAPAGADAYLRVSLRATAAVRHAMACARTPIGYGELVTSLMQTIPYATYERVDGLLSELWRQTVLLTELRPPLTTSDPVRYVADLLAGIPAAQEAFSYLQDVLLASKTWDLTPAAEALPAYRQLIDQARAMPAPAPATPPLQVDVALSLAGRGLTEAVGVEAARVAELLLRISPYPPGVAALVAYRQRFLGRYGADREVPLPELMDPEAGLGPPDMSAGTSQIPRGKAAQRARVLHQLASRALHDRRRVVELDEDTLARLETWSPAPASAPPSLDLYTYVGAASVEALDAGEFQLVLGPNVGALAAGRNLGRFADLLAPEAPTALSRAAAAEQSLASERLFAELVYLPARQRMANVAIRPPTRRYEIVFDASPGVPYEQVIRADELVVGVRDGLFYVRWPAAGAEVVACSGHMLNNANAPSMARFLANIARMGIAHLHAFDWGQVSDFPYLPRVQSGRAVLRPAQWIADHNTLPPEPRSAFAGALARWRAEWDVPRHVALTTADNRLLLDLDCEDQAAELQAELRGLASGQTILLQEMLPTLDQIWTEGPEGHYIAEFVVSLALRERAEPAHSAARNEERYLEQSTAAPAGGQQAVAATMAGALAKGGDEVAPAAEVGTRIRPPGSEWLFVKLYCPQSLDDDLISGPLLAFAEDARAAGQARSWFFLRYRDPDYHVRLRFHGDPERLTRELFPAVCSWAAELMAEGFCRHFSLDSYDRELERYGGLAGAEIAEEIFAADSRAVAALLALLQEDKIGLDRVALATLTSDDLLAGLGYSASERLEQYGAAVESRDEVGVEYRRRKQLLRALLGSRRGLPAIDGGTVVEQILAARRVALAPLAQRLTDLEMRGRLGRTRAALSRSFLHLHCNRLLGLDAEGERQVLGLLLRTRESIERAPLRDEESTVHPADPHSS